MSEVTNEAVALEDEATKEETVVEAKTEKKRKKPVASDATKLRQARAELGKLRKDLEACEEECNILRSKHEVLFAENRRLKETVETIKNDASAMVSTAVNGINNTMQMVTTLYNSTIRTK